MRPKCPATLLILRLRLGLNSSLIGLRHRPVSSASVRLSLSSAVVVPRTHFNSIRARLTNKSRNKPLAQSPSSATGSTAAAAAASDTDTEAEALQDVNPKKKGKKNRKRKKKKTNRQITTTTKENRRKNNAVREEGKEEEGREQQQKRFSLQPEAVRADYMTA